MKIEDHLFYGNCRNVIEEAIYHEGATEIIITRHSFNQLITRLIADQFMHWDGDKGISQINEIYYPLTDVKIKSE